jgi:hypothetical protein
MNKPIMKIEAKRERKKDNKIKKEKKKGRKD